MINDGNDVIGCIIATSVAIGEVNHSTHLPICEQQQVPALNGMALVNLFSPRSSLVSAPSVAEPTSNNNIHLLSNTELLQTRRSSWINTSLIKELCFIFSYPDVIEGTCCCEGIVNAFFIRYCYIHETQLVEPVSSQYYPYLCFLIFYPEFKMFSTSCFSTEVWESLVVIQQAITAMLCCYAQSQGHHPSSRVRVSIPSAVMAHIASLLTSRNIFGYNILL